MKGNNFQSNESKKAHNGTRKFSTDRLALEMGSDNGRIQAQHKLIASIQP
jgi:hypothetical protein